MATAYASISPSFRTPEWRVFRTSLFLAMGLSAVLPVFHGLKVYGYARLARQGLNWVLLQGLLYTIGACLYAARIPEKLYPGKFDIFLSSHQTFHVLVVAAAAAHLRGRVKAFHSKHRGPYATVRVFGKHIEAKKIQ
jgi:adiponectin receptor